MKIIFTGGGTGGHFYPIIAVAQKTNEVIDRENILGAKLYYFSDSPYDKEMLFENGLLYEEISAGKMRTYFSIKNFFDLFKTFFGCISALYKVYSIYPDVIFGKGGYASFPTLLAGRILNIPIVIHESDCAPGRVNKWAGHFAKKIALSFPQAGEYFSEKKIAWTGHPIRAEIENSASRKEALDYFKLESDLPVLFIIGGSQGAEMINDVILDALPTLIQKFQIIHQTGVRNFKMVSEQAKVVLRDNENSSRYTPIAYLNNLQLRMASGASTLIISRAGSTLFEIASWGVPSILIPFTNSNADHAKKNAFNYARAGACSVIEEMNLTANIVIAEIKRIVEDKVLYDKMKQDTINFAHKGGALKIAEELISIAIDHEK